jgi:quercetin dioxygenase-like cupin family protein
MSAQPFAAQFEALGGDLRHHMPDDGSGVYIKETRIPAGVKLDMHVHSFTHKSVLASGRVRVTVGPQVRELEGPAVLTVREGVPHAVEAITPAVWLCIHATAESDADNIDHALVRQQ